MTDPRLLEGPCFKRHTAEPDALSAIRGWDVWVCTETTFQHSYECTVDLYVHEGSAKLAFADGTQVELQPGDAMTIVKGASAAWSIRPPIRNSYIYREAE